MTFSMDPVFCTTLRKRPPWNKVPSILRKADSAWRERTLTFHDIAFPIALETAAAVLVEPRSAREAGASWGERLQKLTLAYGGAHSFVFFILSHGQSGDQSSAMGAFLQFQILTLEFPSTTIIPLTNIDSLPEVITRIQENFTARLIEEEDGPSAAATQILSHCATGPRLSDRHTNMLADLTSNLADAAVKFSSSGSRDVLSSYIGEADAERVVRFFTRNTVV
ncbi:hypothetical protein CFIMG_008531RA00001 [Ceratocystis fimbriata CBS 114723]|uniref:Uncharacterized protein n=1 Tax=Ceratocystis fimbriata CBS 114723 TaxID=1035309 RepID=A0A2C5WS07_9PEZI|nr:hypothetical protein CFIMG_008531RA00001 [Ceratocystis fimbriata CBS 114723]